MIVLVTLDAFDSNSASSILGLVTAALSSLLIVCFAFFY